ncbi:MAG: OsmC family protein [Chlamydiales bacterium]|nr:OsmC family protein [Chlamydiales bacterium]
MIKYPLKFKASAKATPGITNTWTAQAEHNDPIKCAIPPEFMGPGGGYSPEDLYGLALLNCVLATFKVFAEKSNLTFTEVNGTADITIDRGQGGMPWISHIALHATLTGASDPAKGEKVLHESKKACIVCNSMKTEVSFEVSVNP